MLSTVFISVFVGIYDYILIFVNRYIVKIIIIISRIVNAVFPIFHLYLIFPYTIDLYHFIQDIHFFMSLSIDNGFRASVIFHFVNRGISLSHIAVLVDKERCLVTSVLTGFRFPSFSNSVACIARKNISEGIAVKGIVARKIFICFIGAVLMGAVP